MSKKIDLVGKRFGRLVVLRESHKDNGTYWECLCDCGDKTIANTSRLNAAINILSLGLQTLGSSLEAA